MRRHLSEMAVKLRVGNPLVGRVGMLHPCLLFQVLERELYPEPVLFSFCIELTDVHQLYCEPWLLKQRTVFKVSIVCNEGWILQASL